MVKCQLCANLKYKKCVTKVYSKQITNLVYENPYKFYYQH